MYNTRRLPFFIALSILMSNVLAKEVGISNLKYSENNIESFESKNARQGRTFFNSFLPPPPPPPMGMFPPMIPPYYPPSPNPLWYVFDRAGAFLVDMLDVVTSAVGQINLDSGSNYGEYDSPGGGGGYDYGGGGSGYDYGGGGGSDYGGGYDDYRSLTVSPMMQ